MYNNKKRVIEVVTSFIVVQLLNIVINAITDILLIIIFFIINFI